MILSYTDLLNAHDVSFAQKEKNEIMNEILLNVVLKIRISRFAQMDHGEF